MEMRAIACKNATPNDESPAMIWISKNYSVLHVFVPGRSGRARMVAVRGFAHPGFAAVVNDCGLTARVVFTLPGIVLLLAFRKL